jgi:hypothetical protein
VDERKQTLRDPKCGRAQEAVFIPQKLADRLKEYLREKVIKPEQRILLISEPVQGKIPYKLGQNPLAGIEPQLGQ